MRELGDIYESARASIPLSLFAERNSLLAWDELDERVHSELDVLQERIFSALRSDALLLANHHRVIDDFNRGVRDGVLAKPGQEAPEPTGLSRSPFEWGQLVGIESRNSAEADATLIRQFATVTHLLAYEFRQLDLAFGKPIDFLMRNIGPERADEFGELVFAMPVLLNYRRELVARVLDEPGFSFSEFHISQSPQPDHLEYLSQGVVALFDPAPKSWIRVAANLGLATLPFTDGTTLESEHFQAPRQAAVALTVRPIAAQMIVRRQMDRIELARRWIGSNANTIEFEQSERAPTVLWDVYQSTQAGAVRGHDSYFADVVANNVVSLLSAHVEAALEPQDTRLTYFRRHLPAFTRGFDARSHRVVDARALVTAGFGRDLSDGLRRFENGGLYVAGVSQALAELDAAVNELHHAHENFGVFVRTELSENEETHLAGLLLSLFDTYPALPIELFGTDSQYEFFSRTRIQTYAPFDLMRTALFNVVQAMQSSNSNDDSVKGLLANARTSFRRLVELGGSPDEGDENASASSFDAVPVMKPNSKASSEDEALMVLAWHFERDFETFTRLIHQLEHPLYMARMLNQKQSTFLTSFGPG